MAKNSNNIPIPEDDYLYISLSQIPDSGNGLLTAITIYKDEIIATFKGEILTQSQTNSRANNFNNKYFIAMLDGSIMDSMHTHCFAKYANDANGSAHSGFKNNAKIMLDENENVCLIATRKIKNGEEIFCSYGKKYWNNLN
ncbi:MAG: SET domain-containing protein-lysine N-methyltransferase [Bacteroidota bacterium]